MNMDEVRSKLENLQEILVKKYKEESKIQELPQTAEVSRNQLAEYQRTYIAINAEYESEKAKVAALKLELDEAVRARELGEKNMDDIKTHREYEILDKQISEAQSREEEVRKNLQQEEKLLSKLKDDLQVEEEMVNNQKAEVEKDEKNLAENMESSKKELADLIAQEQAASEGLEDEIVYKFQRIIQRNSDGIVAVKRNVCEGCHMILPAQFANEVLRGDKVYFCPYCSRVIYYEKPQGSEEADVGYSTEHTGSLLGVGDDGNSDYFDDVDSDSTESREVDDGGYDSSDSN